MRILQFLGKLLISLGVGVLLFVGWTLKGTDLYTNRAQDRLSQEYESLPPLPAVAAKIGGREYIGPPESFAPGPGESAFRIVIPEIDINRMVVEGVGTEELREGPGHYPECRAGFSRPFCTEFPTTWPGEKGRVIVSGHRTTYGAPFWGLDKLESGDEIRTETKWGNFTYLVTKIEIVPANSLAIAIPSEEAEIVLTTCNPKFSAAERLVVFARLQDVTKA